VLEVLDRAAPPVHATPHEVRRILVAFDGSPGAWAALECGIEIALNQTARLTIAAVVPEARWCAGFGMLVLPVSPETLRKDAEREMCRLLAAARDEVPANVSLTTQVLYGRPARSLAALADRDGYDLVVTGTRLPRRFRTRASVLAIR
jgi:nucleotide-binding universal stress UspA family protein